MTNVPLSPLTLSKDIFLFSVESRLKFFAFSPKLKIGVFVSGVIGKGYYSEKYSLAQGDSVILDDNELRNFSRLMGGGLKGYLQKDAKIKSYSLSGKYKVDGKLFKIKKINWENEAYLEDN